MEALVHLHGSKAVGSLHIYREAEESLVPESIYAIDSGQNRWNVRQALSLSEIRKARGKIGIVGRTWLSGRSQNVKDTRRISNYAQGLTDTRSELGVPIRDQGKVLGVLNAKSDRIAAFDDEDQQALEALAELAIQNARRVEELRTLKALAFMGMGKAVSGHELGGAIGRIRNEIFFLKQRLGTLGLSKDELEQELSRIDLQVEQHFRANRAPQGHPDEDLALISINDILRFRSQPAPSGDDLQFTTELGVDDTICVYVNTEWLHGVLDIIVNNALDATHGQRHREIVLGSRLGRKGKREVEILVSDNGPGIPKELQEIILQEPIPKARGEKGTGTGLLIALQIVGIYSGRMYWERRPEGGTTMVITLPVSKGKKPVAETAPA